MADGAAPPVLGRLGQPRRRPFALHGPHHHAGNCHRQHRPVREGTVAHQGFLPSRLPHRGRPAAPDHSCSPSPGVRRIEEKSLQRRVRQGDLRLRESHHRRRRREVHRQEASEGHLPDIQVRLRRRQPQRQVLPPQDRWRTGQGRGRRNLLHAELDSSQGVLRQAPEAALRVGWDPWTSGDVLEGHPVAAVQRIRHRGRIRRLRRLRDDEQPGKAAVELGASQESAHLPRDALPQRLLGRRKPRGSPAAHQQGLEGSLPPAGTQQGTPVERRRVLACPLDHVLRLRF